MDVREQTPDNRLREQTFVDAMAKSQETLIETTSIVQCKYQAKLPIQKLKNPEIKVDWCNSAVGEAVGRTLMLYRPTGREEKQSQKVAVNRQAVTPLATLYK